MSLRDVAFKGRVIQRVIFDMHRQALDLRVEAGAFGSRPALQCAFDLKAKIVVQARGVMLLNAELQRMVGL